MKTEYPRLKARLVILIAILAIAIRIILALTYGPVAYGDTPSYQRLAEAVLNGFQRYDGTRTPGYPIFLALLGADQTVYVAQMILGILTTLLILWITWRLSANPWLSGAAALAHSLNLGQLFFEASLLTETLSTFFLLLSLAGILYLLTTSTKFELWVAIGIGFSASITAITRPLFIFLPFWLLLFIMWNVGHKSLTQQSPNLNPPKKSLSTFLAPFFTRRTWITAGVFLIPVALIIGGWVSFIHTRYHMWSLSTMTGYHMIQHTGNFFEYLPDEYAVLRDTYLTFRQAHIEEFGTQTNTIWDAIPELQKVSGLTFYDLSRKLSKLSTWLIVHHPILYLRNVLKGWWYFWRAPIYWQAEGFSWHAMTQVIQPLVFAERILLIITNLIFVITTIPVLFIKRIMPQAPSRRAFLWCLVGTIWIASIIQSLVDHGDNPRFLIPMQSIVVLWVLWLAHQAWSILRLKNDQI